MPNDYYAPSKTTILVPVDVEYHGATDTVFRFTSPTMEEVEKALKTMQGYGDKEAAFESLGYLVDRRIEEALDDAALDDHFSPYSP